MRGSENTRSPAGVQVPDAVGFASAPDRSPADRNVGGAMSEVVVPDASRDDAEGYGHDKDGTRTFFKASKEEGGRRKGGPGASIANTVDGAVEPGAPGHSETKSEEIEIHHFAQAGDVEGVRRCLLSGHNANEIDELGCTPVHLAGAMGHTEVVKLLVEEHGADVDARDGASCTSLHAASEGGHPVMIVLLLKLGADVDARNGREQTPLHYACGYGQVKAAQQLTLHGASVSSLDAQGNSPLHLACSGGDADIVRLMIDQGSNIEAHNVRRRRPLHLACRSGHLDVVITLLEHGADPSSRDATGLQAADMIGAKRPVPSSARLEILNALERCQLGDFAVGRAPIYGVQSRRYPWMERDHPGERVGATVTGGISHEAPAGSSSTTSRPFLTEAGAPGGLGGSGGGVIGPQWEVGAAVAGRLEEMRARELGASLRAKVQENEAMRRYLESVKEEMRVLQMKLSRHEDNLQRSSSSLSSVTTTLFGTGGVSGASERHSETLNPSSASSAVAGESLESVGPVQDAVGTGDREPGTIAERVARCMYAAHGIGGREGNFGVVANPNASYRAAGHTFPLGPLPVAGAAEADGGLASYQETDYGAIRRDGLRGEVAEGAFELREGVGGTAQASREATAPLHCSSTGKDGVNLRGGPAGRKRPPTDGQPRKDGSLPVTMSQLLMEKKAQLQSLIDKQPGRAST